MASNIKFGDTVLCTHAASSWFTVGECYLVEKHPESGYAAVRAADGLYDMLSLVVSKFEKVRKDPEE